MSHWKATRKQLRGTGLVVGIALGVFTGLQMLFHGHLSHPPTPYYLFGASALLILLGLLAPGLLRPFHFIWMKFAEALGWVMNRVILGILFFIFFTLTGLVIRLIGRDVLDKDFRRKRESYWIRRSDPERPRERYERQF